MKIQFKIRAEPAEVTDSSPVAKQKCYAGYFKVGFYLKAVFPLRNLGLMRYLVQVSSNRKAVHLSHEFMFYGVL